ncbi:hypothetical protein N0V90_011021 [Kalmusia sp. IMI 367209]|nr:hypothetical protein N0V90_011021 [Kalmusia sp. IMI 367209]
MAGWDRFHKKMVAARPQDVPSKRYLVGVLFVNKEPDDELSEWDFQWVITRGDTSIKKIKNKFESRHPDVEIDIWFNDAIASPDTLSKNLDIYNDSFIALRALQKPSSSYTSPYAAALGPGVETKGQPPRIPSPTAQLSTEIQSAPDSASEPKTQEPLLVKLERLSFSPFESPSSDEMISINLEDVLDHESAFENSPGIKANVQLVDRYVREVISQQNAEVLETSVKRSMKILDKLRDSLTQFAETSPEAVMWMKSIEKLKNQPERSRTIVGVVGNTGAGKSSVINAMLDEERLVPTNCMRACTSVVTELSWNDSEDPACRYSAEIEFIGRADWEKELRNLMKEFLTENGNLVREASEKNSEAGIAWAKFHAVYPKITRDLLHHCTVEKLMAETPELDVLGTTRLINRAHSGPFYVELQKYVDSKEKVTGKKSKEQKEREKYSRKQMEVWPLIKVVKIYTKAAALSTGAVIVDLPGVHDSNAARAAVAERYMKECSGLWIVAPITRAVDDKAAKNLLGDSFKRQLKYDGNYSAVTFICSKTDDISITEAIDSLELYDEVSELQTKIREHRQEILNTQQVIDNWKETADIYKATSNEADDEIEKWEDLKDRVNTEDIYAPKRKPSHKRKKAASKIIPRKRQQIEENSDAEYIESGSDDASDTGSASNMEGVDAVQEPLTMQDIEEKLSELRNTKKSARQGKRKAEDEIKDLRPVLRELKAKIIEVKTDIKTICIEGRNKYSTGAIQHDFAVGIKELDQENAIEEDEANFNPDEDIRDYDEVAISLPVFCVSSRAYQKMCGRFKNDEDVPGFQTVEGTGIPQLQTHCRMLTENGRIQTCRAFLTNLCHLLTTISLWISHDGTGLKMTDDDKCKEIDYLHKEFNKLENGLEQVVADCLGVMKKELREQIFEKYPELISEAVQSAPTISSKWGDRSQGGLYYMTYKAVVRRGGSYHSPAAGHREFNAELLDPITKRLATGWERAFQRRLPRAIETYAEDAAKALYAFHAKIEERARQNKIGLANLAMLKGTIYTYERMFHNFNAQLCIRMTELQRDANRDFVPAVATIMKTVYDICANEYGTGSYMRMKNHMATFVPQQSAKMFLAATETVEQALLQMCRELEEKMANKVDEIFSLMRTDYTRVLGGAQATQDVMSKPEQYLRAEVNAQLREIDSQFERIAKGKLPIEQASANEIPGNDSEEPEVASIVGQVYSHENVHGAENADAGSGFQSALDAITAQHVEDDTESSPAEYKRSSKQLTIKNDEDEDEDEDGEY